VIVLGSSFIVAFHNQDDVHHDSAVGIMDRIVAGEWESAALVEYVFLEVVTVLRLRLDLLTATTVGDTLLRAREVEFVPCSEVFLEAFEVFRNEEAAPLSFVDAAVAAVARRRSPGWVATFDRDFADLDGVTVVD